MPGSNKQSRNSAASIIDVLVACAVLALIGCVVLPALSKERDDARIAECADHLKQLGQAAHQYAADFDGKFFYNRSSKGGRDTPYQPELVGLWYDKERIGRYINGEPMYLPWKEMPYAERFKPIEGVPPPDWPYIGLGGGVFVCPSDAEDAGRSYQMNFWAGNGYNIDPVLSLPFMKGELFDSNSPKLDRLLIFTDVLGFQPTAKGWVTTGRLGWDGLPSQRFGARKVPVFSSWPSFRYGDTHWYKSRLDYVRHGENQDRFKPEGAVNIGYADGHVDLRTHDQLCDPKTYRSTYNTLWSPIDESVEDVEYSKSQED